MASMGRERRRRARLRAEAREQRRARVRLRRKIKRFVFGSIVGFGGLMIVLSLVLPNSLGNAGGGAGSTSSGEGFQVAIQGNDVVEAGQDHADYSTTPPTSGWRYEIPLEEMVWGVKEEPMENETQVAYLERGAVVIQYNCPDGCPDLLQKLERVANRYAEGVVLAPYAGLEGSIAVTAWGWMDTLEEFDDPRIDDFIRTHIDQGPRSFTEPLGGE